MPRFTHAAIAFLFALTVPTLAHATPIAFEFSGYVDKTGPYSGIAEGDPLTATLRYDPDVWFKVDDDGDHILYSGTADFVFEIHAGPYSWSGNRSLTVWKSGDRLEIGLQNFFAAFARLEGPGLLPPGGAAPTSFNLAAMTSDMVLGGFPNEGRALLHFTSVVQTQGPGADPIAAPEPATLTLSAFGLAALLARRRRTRVTRVWHAGGEVFHAATKTRP
jgi:hypothetical protein